MWQGLTGKDVLICMGKYVLFLRKHVPKTNVLFFVQLKIFREQIKKEKRV